MITNIKEAQRKKNRKEEADKLLSDIRHRVWVLEQELKDPEVVDIALIHRAWEILEKIEL